MTSHAADTAHRDLPKAPSPTTRAVISYLLFIHFFFLLVGIKSYSPSSSGLDQDLRNKIPGLKPYLQFAAMDLSYMFHLTYYDGFQNLQDTDYFVEADVTLGDGSTKLVRLDPVRAFPPIRGRRYERLAFRAALFAESGNDNLVSLLPVAMARRIFLEQRAVDPECRQMTLRVKRRLLQNLMLPADDPGAAAERQRSPDDPSYFQTAYEARAFITDDGEVNVAQIKAASDTAAPLGPTTGRPATPSPTTPPTSAVPSPAPAAPTASPLGLPPLPLPTAIPLPTAQPTGGPRS
jgi:hypothetical protein